MSTLHRTRHGFTLVETMIFMAITALLSGTLLSTYIATQDARIRQQALSSVEQDGILLLSRMASAIRASEAILLPAVGSTDDLLALQQRSNAEHPTIFLRTATGDLLLMQKEAATSLLSHRLTTENFSVRNLDGSTVVLSFDLKTMIGTRPPVPYMRHFQTTVTRFPDETAEAGGCGPCTAPTCASGVLQWYECVQDACALSPLTLAC